jgi:hypothetical protein
MEVTRRRGRRHTKLLDYLQDRREYSHLKEEALDRTMWRNRFGESFGPVVRQNTEWMNGITVVPHLPYSWDLAHYDYFLFLGSSWHWREGDFIKQAWFQNDCKLYLQSSVDWMLTNASNMAQLLSCYIKS